MARKSKEADLKFCEIIKNGLEQGLSIRKISKQNNVSQTYLHNLIKRHNLSTQNIKKKRDISDDQILELYNLGWSCLKIANHFNRGSAFAASRLKNLGIDVSRGYKKHNKITDKKTKNLILDDYKNGETIKYIEKKYNTSKTIIIRIARENGVKSHPRFISQTEKLNIVNTYKDKKSIFGVAKLLDRSENGIKKTLLQDNIKIIESKGENCWNWSGGTTKLNHLVRESYSGSQWRKKCFERDGFKSVLGGAGNKLNCHHIIPLSKIFENCLRKYSVLPDDLKKECVKNDPRFFDTSNGITVLESEHALLEKTPKDAYPIWRLQKTFPGYSLNNQKIDLSLFDDHGKITVKKFQLITGINDNGRNLIRYQHYIGKIPPHNLVLSAYVDNVIVGLAAFGRGGNRYLPKDSWELLRLCVPYWVKNQFCSGFISKCLKYIKNYHKKIKRIIAFCDPNVGHSGGVYRACSWSECGVTEKSYCYYDELNKTLLHKSACRRIKGVDKTEKQLALERGLIKIVTCPKIRFLKTL